MRVHAVPASDAPAGREVAGASQRPLSTSPLPVSPPARSPLLSGTLKDAALNLADALARSLPAAAAAGHRNPSLASGSAGLAVCAGQFARSRPDQPAAETALTHLEDAVEMLGTEP